MVGFHQGNQSSIPQTFQYHHALKRKGEKNGNHNETIIRSTSTAIVVAGNAPWSPRTLPGTTEKRRGHGGWHGLTHSTVK